MMVMNCQLTGVRIGGLRMIGKHGAAQLASASASHWVCHVLSEAGPDAASFAIVAL